MTIDDVANCTQTTNASVVEVEIEHSGVKTLSAGESAIIQCTATGHMFTGLSLDILELVLCDGDSVIVYDAGVEVGQFMGRLSCKIIPKPTNTFTRYGQHSSAPRLYFILHMKGGEVSSRHVKVLFAG